MVCATVESGLWELLELGEALRAQGPRQPEGCRLWLDDLARAGPSPRPPAAFQ